MIDIPVGISLAAIGLLAFVALGRSLFTGRRQIVRIATPPAAVTYHRGDRRRICEHRRQRCNRLGRRIAQLANLARRLGAGGRIGRAELGNQLANIAALGAGQVPVEADPDLESGQARIECRLEQIDLDVRAQWASLSALLDVMAKDDPA